MWGGKGSDIIEIYFASGPNHQVGASSGAIIFGDTGREADISAEGSGADHILGFGGIDTIFAGGGDDYVNAHSGDDDVYGGAGNDYLLGGNGADTIAGDAGDDVIYGGSPATVPVNILKSIVINYNGDTDALIPPEPTTGIPGDMAADDESNDVLDGGAGNDTINGGRGADQMTGGLGDDRFYVDNVGDRVYEATAQGNDAAYSSVSYTLTASQSIETLSTTVQAGTTAINLAGNELAQRINGNEGTNTLSGLAGNDTLVGYGGTDWLKGGPGNDTLYGGNGNDNFVFNTALNASTNVDRIMDFSVPADTIYLDNAVMAGVGATLGTLSAAKFWKSTAGIAHDADDRIIYDIDTGRLFYDANGNASGGATHFATLAPNLALTNADFVVF